MESNILRAVGYALGVFDGLVIDSLRCFHASQAADISNPSKLGTLTHDMCACMCVCRCIYIYTF